MAATLSSYRRALLATTVIVNSFGAAVAGSSPSPSEAITGKEVTNGGTATPTLNLGAIHVGSSTSTSFQIENSGPSASSLNGTVSTSGVTNAGLAAPTAGSFGPIKGGKSSGNYVVTFTGSQAGALTGQNIVVTSNAGADPTQTIAVVGAAYNLAAYAPLASLYNLGNTHVGGTLGAYLDIENTAPADGYSESLDAKFGATTLQARDNGGSVTGLAAGSSDSTDMSVSLDASSAGAKTGTVVIKFTSDGQGTSGLANTQLESETVALTGGVYRLARPSTPSSPVNLGAYHVSGASHGGPNPTVLTGSVKVTNDVTNDGYSEDLDVTGASFPTGDGFAVTTTIPITGIAPQSSSSVGVAYAPGASWGVQTGALTLKFQSDGGTGAGSIDGLGATPLTADSKTVTVNATGYEYADPQYQLAGHASKHLVQGSGPTLTEIDPTDFTLNMGEVDIHNGGYDRAYLDILNALQDGASSTYTDRLKGSFDKSAVKGFTLTGFGGFNDIAGGDQYDDGGLFSVLFDPTKIGSYTDIVTFDPVSDNTAGLGDTDLSAITLTIVGSGVPEPSTWALLALGFAGLGYAAARRDKGATRLEIV